MSCPYCQEATRFINYRPKAIVSLVGDLRIERGYYSCKSCGRGHFPWDAILRLSPQRLTPAAQEVTALAGIQESFSKAAERTLRKLAGIRLSESSVERTTEAAGQRLGQALQGGAVFGEKRMWDWHRDRTGKTWAAYAHDSGPFFCVLPISLVIAVLLWLVTSSRVPKSQTVLAKGAKGGKWLKAQVRAGNINAQSPGSLFGNKGKNLRETNAK